MALFGETRGPEGALPAGPSAPNQINMIGEGTVFEGTLRARSDVRVSGRIVGKLQVEGKAIVAQEGSVEGEVHAASADIAGTIEGDLHVTDRLVLKGTARVEGNIRTGRLVVEEGATFNGKCLMGEQRPERLERLAPNGSRAHEDVKAAPQADAKATAS